MGRLCCFVLLCLALTALFHNTGGAKSKTKTPPKKPTSPNKPAQGSSSTGGRPKQSPSSGAKPTTRSYPAAGGAQAGGRYPAGGGYPNQYPVRGGVNTGGYPNQNPAGGTYQHPGTGGGGSYPYWNPNNKILSPRYGGAFGGGGYGGGGHGSPFSRTVQNMGYAPSEKSKGFGKTAVLAAGAGAMVGMAVGYGLGRHPEPHFKFRNQQEEQHYNYYMHQHYGKKSTDNNNYRQDNNRQDNNRLDNNRQDNNRLDNNRQDNNRLDNNRQDNKFEPLPHALTYEKYMDSCMNRTDLLQDQSPMPGSVRKTVSVSGTLERDDLNQNGTKPGVNQTNMVQESEEDTVSITEIGYPALLQQMKARKCVEMYMEYSDKQTGARNKLGYSPCASGLVLLLMSISGVLLQ